MKKWCSFVILLLFPFLIISCSKKDDNSVNTGNQDGLSIPAFSFKGPGTWSNNQYAVQTKTHVSSVNDYLDLFRLPFAHIQPSKSGNQWTWVFEAGGGATETLEALKNKDGSASWELFLNGNIYGTDYNNLKIIDGTTSSDEKNGNWNFYDKTSATPVAKVSWTTDPNGVVSGSLTNYSFLVVTGKKEIVNRPDNSGGLTVYGQNNMKTFLSSWKSDGSGEWKSFSDGVETSSGSWQ